jgi:glucosamine--fructose-6-phosphate aminotransferase (isomerizing)
MCGIFGYIGSKAAYEEVYTGLKKLEYRGYDSCGISVIEKNKFKTVKKVGGPENLKGKSRSKSTIAIGHTRWATHGVVNTKNAHPHISCDGAIALVHNGVVENSDTFECERKSDTDSEVIANLIATEYNVGNIALGKAVELAVDKLDGTYGIAVIHRNDPNTIVVARRGSPLVIGISKDETETYIASDTYALPSDISRVIYLEDEEVATISSSDLSIRKADKSVHPRISNIHHRTNTEYTKQSFQTFLEKEIRDQPTAIRNAMRGRFSKDYSEVKFGGIKFRKKVRRILFLGCGTAYHAGLVGKYLMENIAGIPASVEYSSEYKYKNNPTEDGTLIVAISQSGETIDTISAVEEAQSHDRMVISITNTVASSLARLTKMGIYQYAGQEVSVASSKSFTSQLTLLIMLAIYIGRKHNLSKVASKKYISQLRRLPALAERTLECGPAMKSMSVKWGKTQALAFLGRQLMYPIAIEGALKMKELAYLECHGYPAGELKHGPLAAIGYRATCIYIAPQKELYEKNLSNMREIMARDSHIILITQDGLNFPEDTYDNVIYLPKAPDILQPILAVIPLQFFSLYMALGKKYDVDRPRHLAKSVTVE